MVLNSTIFVNVDADTVATFNEFFSRLVGNDNSNFTSECNRLFEIGQIEKLIDRYLEHIDSIFNLDSENDIDGSLQTIVSIVFSFREGENISPILRSIVDRLSSNTAHDSKEKFRLRSIINLVNLATTFQTKFYALSVALKFALLTCQTKYVRSFHEHVDGWINEWNLSLEDTRVLYRLMSDILAKENDTSLAVKFLSRYLKTLGDSTVTSEIESFTTTSLLNAIKSPVQSFMYRADVLESIPNVVTEDIGKLVELLHIICDGELDSYADFEAKNIALMKSHGLSTQELKDSILLLSICTLLVQHSVVTFQEISAHVNVPLEDVETWVVEAISAGLVEAYIDQSAGSVITRSTRHLSFGMSQWKQVQTKIKVVKQNVSRVVDLKL